jgi:hypothetical protein
LQLFCILSVEAGHDGATVGLVGENFLNSHLEADGKQGDEYKFHPIRLDGLPCGCEYRTGLKGRAVPNAPRRLLFMIHEKSRTGKLHRD